MSTVEFLRARLLSERSVSRTARQRADQLAKRVAELEEHLRIVTNQRKEAERAAAVVLSILETQGVVGNFSEVVDSSSDHETTPLQPTPTPTPKPKHDVQQSSNTTSIIDKCDDGTSQALERETPPSQGTTLSWRKRSDNLTKFNHNRQRHRRRTFICTSESSSTANHHLGHSCRKTKRRDALHMLSDQNNKSLSHASGTKEKGSREEVDTQNGFTADSNDFGDQHYDSITSSGEVQSKSVDSPHSGSGVEEMEKALEKQAHFIRQHQSEENSQKEWEEKFNTSIHSDMDNYKSVKMNDTREDTVGQADEVPNSSIDISRNNKEMDSCKVPSPKVVNVITCDDNSAALGSKRSLTGNAEMASTLPNGHKFPDKSITCEIEHLDDKYNRSAEQIQHENPFAINGPEDHYQDYKFPKKGSTCRMGGDGHHACVRPDVDRSDIVSYCSGSKRLMNGSHGNDLCSTNSSLRFSEEQCTVYQNGEPKQLPQSRQNGQGVLEALQRAKLSLKQELQRSSSRSQGTLTVPSDTYTHAAESWPMLDIPVGSASLFRLPTDFSPQVDFCRPTYRNFSSSSSLPHSDNNFPISSSSARQNLSYYSGSDLYKIPTGAYGIGSHVSTSTVALQKYTNTYPSYHSKYTTPISDDLKHSYTSFKSEGLGKDRYSLVGTDLSYLDARRI